MCIKIQLCFNGLKLLPPANEVWGKVICLQACVCPKGGGVVHGPGVVVHGPGGGVHGPRGVHGPGGYMVPGDAWSWGGGG